MSEPTEPKKKGAPAGYHRARKEGGISGLLRYQLVGDPADGDKGNSIAKRLRTALGDTETWPKAAGDHESLVSYAREQLEEALTLVVEAESKLRCLGKDWSPSGRGGRGPRVKFEEGQKVVLTDKALEIYQHFGAGDDTVFTVSKIINKIAQIENESAGLSLTVEQRYLRAK